MDFLRVSIFPKHRDSAAGPRGVFYLFQRGQDALPDFLLGHLRVVDQLEQDLPETRGSVSGRIRQ